MSALHLHLLFTHAPLFGVAFGAFALAYALIRRHGPTCDVAYAIFVASGFLTGITYITGSLAEEAAEKLPGVTESLVEAHQETAVVALVILRRFQTIAWSRSIVAALALAAFVSMGYAANLGGQIRHTEIRSGAPGSSGDATRESGD